MKELFTFLAILICFYSFGQHKSYRTDIFDFSRYKWYYAAAEEDFMAKYNLRPGDTIAIKDNVDTIYNINLGNAKLNGITFINDTGNKRQILLGYFVLGNNCYDVKFLGNGSKNVRHGFRLFDSKHFGLSWEAVGDLEAAYLDFNGCLIGVQLVTKPERRYPLQYQNLHAHHLHFKNIHNEAMYLGYVKMNSIFMNLDIHDIIIDSAGWDGIQTRNTRSTRIYNCNLTNIGLANHWGDQHAILLGNNIDSAIIKNVRVRNCKGSGVFNGGFGNFLFEKNDIESDGQSIYNRAYNPDDTLYFGDDQKIGFQNTIIRCNRFRSRRGVTVQYNTNAALRKIVTLTATGNNCEGVFNAARDVKLSLKNNSLGADCN